MAVVVAPQPLVVLEPCSARAVALGSSEVRAMDDKDPFIDREPVSFVDPPKTDSGSMAGVAGLLLGVPYEREQGPAPSPHSPQV